MEARSVNTQPIRELSTRARRALMESGLWMRIGFIGASGVAAGLIQLINGDVRPISAVALALGGGVLAVSSWWRAGAVLDSADEPARMVPPTDRDHVLAGA